MTRASEQRRCALDRAANRDAARANAGANQSAAHAISDAKNDARHERPQARTDAYRVLAQEKGKHAPTAAQPIANSRFHAAKQAFTEVDSYPHRSAARARPALHNGRALGSADKRDLSNLRPGASSRVCARGTCRYAGGTTHRRTSVRNASIRNDARSASAGQNPRRSSSR